jgi:Uncharacterized protein conserved in bacteria (DUF2059)
VKILICMCCVVLHSFGQTQGHPENSPAEQQNAQAQPAPTSPVAQAESKIDPAKEIDIRKLLEISGAKRLVEQSMEASEKSIRPLMTSSLPPGEYREKFIELFFTKFHSKADTQQLLDMLIPIYDKNLSHEDIKGMIEFYGTPLGQKTLTVIPAIMAEAREAGRKWGENLGRQTVKEVLAEHPEFVKEMENSQKTVQTPQQSSSAPKDP